MPTDTPDQRLQAMLAEHGHVVRLAIARVAPRAQPAERDDIEQEVRLRLWRSLQRETPIERPAAYLYRIAVHSTLDALGRRGARREQSLEVTDGAEWVDPRASPERAATRRQQLESVRAAVSRLSANRRRAVGLHLQGFSTSEVASFCSWTEAKARNLVYRGLADLRRHLDARPLASAADADDAPRSASTLNPLERAGHAAV